MSSLGALVFDFVRVLLVHEHHRVVHRFFFLPLLKFPGDLLEFDPDVFEGSLPGRNFEVKVVRGQVRPVDPGDVAEDDVGSALGLIVDIHQGTIVFGLDVASRLVLESLLWRIESTPFVGGFVTAIFHRWEAVHAQVIWQVLIDSADGANFDGLST